MDHVPNLSTVRSKEFLPNKEIRDFSKGLSVTFKVALDDDAHRLLRAQYLMIVVLFWLFREPGIHDHRDKLDGGFPRVLELPIRIIAVNINEFMLGQDAQGVNTDAGMVEAALAVKQSV